MIFPKAAALYPFREEVTLTSNSGVEVPKATTVNPMAMFEILNFLATDEAPLTRKSAPFIRIAKPMRSNVMAKNIRFGFWVAER